MCRALWPFYHAGLNRPLIFCHIPSKTEAPATCYRPFLTYDGTQQRPILSQQSLWEAHFCATHCPARSPLCFQNKALCLHYGYEGLHEGVGIKWSTAEGWGWGMYSRKRGGDFRKLKVLRCSTHGMGLYHMRNGTSRESYPGPPRWQAVNLSIAPLLTGLVRGTLENPYEYCYGYS
jgi:hypothetical protein